MYSRIVLFACCFIVVVANGQTFTDVTPANFPALETARVAWADYNNDGYLDFAVMGAATNGYGAIFTGAGDGTFQINGNSNIPQYKKGDLDWGDFDNDGDLDLAIVAESSSQTIVLRNNITSFEKYIVDDALWSAGSVRWFDYDNDGDLDLNRLGWGATIIYVNTDGVLTKTNSFAATAYQDQTYVEKTTMTIPDFDNDGDQDIFASGKYAAGVWSNATVYINNGVQDIKSSDEYRFSLNDVEVANGDIEHADFNGDGIVDYMITGDNSSISDQVKPVTTLLIGTPAGSLVRSGTFDAVYASSVAVGDIDNDGDLDIVLAGSTGTTSIMKVHLNDGHASFSELPNSGLIGFSSCSVGLGDYDNDGDLDILVAGKNASAQKASKLYKNNLKSGSLSPNEKPSPPVSLTYKFENNSLIMEWGSGNDKETPANALSYNTYVAIQSQRPFKLFPEADAATGKRRVSQVGNVFNNKRWFIKGLKSGDYRFSVQSIDGANAGSNFATEVPFKFIKIETDVPTCDGQQQVFYVKPDGSYSWSVSGGQIVQGQGTKQVTVQWAKGAANPSVAITGNGTSNSFSPIVNRAPDASIQGLAMVCNPTNYADYRGTYNENYSYKWNIDGTDLGTQSAINYYQWTSKGQKSVNLQVTDKTTGCTNSNSLVVKVGEIIYVNVERDGDIYTIANQAPDYTYKWEKYENSAYVTVGTKPVFVPTAIGSYVASITDEFSCRWTRNVSVNEIITGVGDIIDEPQLFPNPARSSFEIRNLSSTSEQVIVTVRDVTGREMLTQSTSSDELIINCSLFPTGVYFVSIDLGTRVVHSKVVIE